MYNSNVVNYEIKNFEENVDWVQEAQKRKEMKIAQLIIRADSLKQLSEFEMAIQNLEHALEIEFSRDVQDLISEFKDEHCKYKIRLVDEIYDKADYFYSQLTNLDYDIIGISYYPLWHGKSLDTLQTQLLSLSSKFNKPILIAETAYPFTFGWNDWTNNIIGDSSQILPQFSASVQGQKDYLNKIKDVISNTPKGIGFAYWGAEFISFKGSEAKNGSSWENQALWDFNNKALPAMSVFNE